MGRMGAGPQGGEEAMHCVKVGKLNLVDLAGSERVHITGATGVHSYNSVSCSGRVASHHQTSSE